MVDYIQPISNCLAVRARVALTLASAIRTLKVLQNVKTIHNAAKVALEDAWQWEIEQKISASQLYQHIHPLLLYESELDKDSPQLSALFSTISAMYYTTWLADGCERLLPNGKRPLLPNDIAEISEDSLSESLAFATQAAKDKNSEIAWQLSAIEKLISNYKVNFPESLGVPISLQFFEDLKIN